MFEGIGGVMPIMAVVKDRNSFPSLVTAALTLLCIVYISFAELCYYTFGDNLTETIVMEMMPSDNRLI